MKCSECKYRLKVKEPIGGLKKSGMRFCTKGKTEIPLIKKNIPNPFGPSTVEYPIGCNGDGVPFYRA